MLIEAKQTQLATLVFKAGKVFFWGDPGFGYGPLKQVKFARGRISCTALYSPIKLRQYILMISLPPPLYSEAQLTLEQRYSYKYHAISRVQQYQ